MAEDKDIALSLPKQPPAAPARREAAIDAALRRFDGADEAVVRPTPTRPAGGWSRINRPQLGALVAAGLVALIFAPVAWMTAGQHSSPPSEMARVSQDIKAFDVAEGPPAMVAPPPLALQEGQPAPKAMFEPPARDDAKGAAPQQSAIMADRQEIVSELHVEAPPMMARPSGRADNASVVAHMEPVPAAPAPAAKAEDAAGAPAYDVIVTAQRRSAGRGDWNACTINDPGRDLARCRKLIDPGAAGTRGRAAAYVADGLNRAWQGDNDGAIAAFDRAIAIAPKLSIAYLNRGLVHRQDGDVDKAIADLDQAVRYAPQAPRGYYNRSVLLRGRGDDHRAKADEDRALAIDPGYEAVIK
jgi:hypothetical protein